MIDLNELAADLRKPRVANLRGNPVSYTLIDAGTARLLRQAIRRPEPTKLRKDPTRGSLAPPIPDETDPEYVAEYDRWTRLLTSAEIGVSLMRGGSVVGLPQEPDWNDTAAVLAFAKSCDDAIRNAFGAGELALLGNLIYATVRPPAAETSPDE